MRNSIRLWKRKVNTKRFGLKCRFYIVVPALLSLLIPVSPAPAQRESENIRLVGRALMGTVNAIAVGGNIAYLGTGAGLLVLDVTDPANPRELSRMFLPVYVRDVAVSGRLLFVTGGAELRIFDVSDPAQLAEEGIFRTTSGYLGRIAVDGSLVYVTGSPLLLQVLDVSDPRQPRQVGRFSDQGSGSTSIAIAGRLAYVGDARRFHIMDISDPANPRERGSVRGFSANDVAASGSFAYVTFAEIQTNKTGLLILDVSDSDHPVERSRLELPPVAIGITLSGSLAYIADGRAGLRIIDVSDPDHPQEVGFLDAPSFAFDVVVSGDMAYVADDSGLRIIDVSDPRNPHELGFDTTVPFRLGQIALSRDLLYVLGTAGLAIFNLSEPTRPQLLAFRYSYDAFTLPYSVAATKDFFMIGTVDSVRIFDASDPNALIEKGSYPTPSAVRGLAVADGLIYVADAEAGLLILAPIDYTLQANPPSTRVSANAGWRRLT